ncbi:MAG: hypothetical protein ACLQAT_29565 [Candidatus Binataceae bacterium]
MRRFAIGTASAMLGIALSLSMANCRNQSAKETTAEKVAAEKAECDAVMQALGQGKKPDEVAASMKIPYSAVFRCLRQANKAAVERQMREHAAEAGTASAEASPSVSAP